MLMLNFLQRYIKNVKKTKNAAIFYLILFRFYYILVESDKKFEKMSDFKREDYTLELNEVIDYMSTILYNEFPTDVLTIEYLVLSILDNKNSHANIILENCLMSDNIEELRKIYVSVLDKYTKPQLKNGAIANKYSDELVKAINCARIEADKLSSRQIGTEHILLSVLNKDNGFQEYKIFGKFNLEYKFIFNKCNCSENSKSTKKVQNKKNKLSVRLPQMQLKSQINPKMVSNQVGEYIQQYTININKLVMNGKVDDVIGREQEMSEMIKVLCRRKKNNVILVGVGGSGKTSIVYGLANMLVKGDVPEFLQDKEILMMNPMAMISGTHFRGMFEERVNGLFTELKKSEKYILFIDDIHTVLRSNGKERDNDISGMVGNILTDGSVRVIGATTFKDYRNTIENNSSLSRKFQKITVEPTSNEETVDIINASKWYYEDFHNVRFTDAAIKKAVDLSERYITDRALPDSAFDVIDLAGASASLKYTEPQEIKSLRKRLTEINDEKENALNNGDFEKIDVLSAEGNVLSSDIAEYKRLKNKEHSEPYEINEDEIANTVSEMVNIPVNKLTVSEKEKISKIDALLKESIIGQDEAINDICKVIKRNKIGLSDKTSCLGTFLLLGPTGVGKSLLAKKIAEEVYGSDKALIRIDMSEYSEKNSVTKLYGTSAGYIGYDDGGILTNAIKRKPYSVVLLDEIEKADESIYNVFLQVFDEGRLTEGNGNLIDCHNCIFIMTSNVGARQASELGKGLGFTPNEESNKKEILSKELKRKFTPEFLNRINKIIYFNNLSDNDLKNIVNLELIKFNNKLNNINYNIIYNNSIIDYIYSKAIESRELGARPIIRVIESEIEDKITELLLTNEYDNGYTFNATSDGTTIYIT